MSVIPSVTLREEGSQRWDNPEKVLGQLVWLMDNQKDTLKEGRKVRALWRAFHMLYFIYSKMFILM